MIGKLILVIVKVWNVKIFEGKKRKKMRENEEREERKEDGGDRKCLNVTINLTETMN